MIKCSQACGANQCCSRVARSLSYGSFSFFTFLSRELCRSHRPDGFFTETFGEQRCRRSYGFTMISAWFTCRTDSSAETFIPRLQYDTKCLCNMCWTSPRQPPSSGNQAPPCLYVLKPDSTSLKDKNCTRHKQTSNINAPVENNRSL